MADNLELLGKRPEGGVAPLESSDKTKSASPQQDAAPADDPDGDLPF